MHFYFWETLNDRGLVLNAVDLIKNKLFQEFSTGINEFPQLKTDCETMCDNIENKNNLRKYLLHYWHSTLRYVTSQTLYKTYKEYISKDSYIRAETIVKGLKEYCTYYNCLCVPMAAHPRTGKTLKHTLETMNKIDYDITSQILLSSVRHFPHNEAKSSIITLPMLP